MPTVGISIARLRKLMRADVDDVRLEQLLDQLGCDLEGITTVRRYVSRHSDYAIELTPSESLPLTDPGSGVSGEKAEDVWQLAGEEQVIRMELLPVRPDIFDAGGLARALRGYLNIDVGLPHYNVVEPGPLGEGEGRRWRIEVAAEIADPGFRRPYIQAAIIRGLHIDEELLRAMMRLQEHLHWALARDRKFASIGVYDLSKLRGPLRYELVDRDSFRFTPLFWGHRQPVSPATMLAEHPKGMGYSHLVEGLARLPALVAANDVVLSLPPIINAEESKVTADTRDVLIDVTGSNLPVVTRALNIMATSLLELDVRGGAHIERVEIAYPDRSERTPELANAQFELHPQRAAKLIGVDLTREQVRELLLKMRHGVEDSGVGAPDDVSSRASAHGPGPASKASFAGSGARDLSQPDVERGNESDQAGLAGRSVSPSGAERSEEQDSTVDSDTAAVASTNQQIKANAGPLIVTVGPFRNDIMHEVDLIEDVAIAYGYHHVVPQLVPSFTAARTLRINDLSRRAASALAGLGFIESLSLVLTSERDHYEKLRLPVNPRRVTLQNPISVDQTMLREHLYAGLLALLASNTDQPLPQRVFEVGDVARYLDASGAGARASQDKADPPPTELRLIAGAICATRAGYAEGRGTLDALLHELALNGLTYVADDNPSALPGRAAAVLDGNGMRVAEVFEAHPEVLEAWRLENPVVLFSVVLGEVEYY